MRQADHILGKARFVVFALLSGIVLFLFGKWCLKSCDIPPPTLALPLPPRLLTGLGMMFWVPYSLIPITLLLTASRFLASKLSRLSAVAVALVGLGAVLVGAFWVPNPIAFWPMSVLGEHTLPELIGELFKFHLVPSPEGSYSSDAGFEQLVRWQTFECGARFVILIIGGIAGLVAIWMIDRRLRSANSRHHVTAAEP